MKPQAFVVLPAGHPTGLDSPPVDFDRIYSDLLQPALAAAGLAVFKNQPDTRDGEPGDDGFQELLFADLVVVDVTFDHAWSWYALGVCHALRAHRVIQVHGSPADRPIANSGYHRLPYRLRNGLPDPDTLHVDRAALTALALSLQNPATPGRSDPLFDRLPDLEQALWHPETAVETNRLTAAYAHWAEHVERARRQNLPGDLLVLANEIPFRALQSVVRRMAGEVLLEFDQYSLALEQFEAVLTIDPDHRSTRRNQIRCLIHLGRFAEARQMARRLCDDDPRDARSLALAAALEKERWFSKWYRTNRSPARLRTAARRKKKGLKSAVALYTRAFIVDPADHRAGVNALTLLILGRHLAIDGFRDRDPDDLAGGVRWANLSARQRDRNDWQAHASHAQCDLLIGPGSNIGPVYDQLVTIAKGNLRALTTIRQTLQRIEAVDFRPKKTRAALGRIDRAIVRSDERLSPRQVLLFSGHMIDAPDRSEPRFPAERAGLAAEKIAALLDQLALAPEDLALSQAANGGDLLFIEACQERGLRQRILLPFEEAEFIERSVLPCRDGEHWRQRYFAAVDKLAERPRIMPKELGTPFRDPQGSLLSPFERCNLWLLYTALSWGIDKVRFICLWNGEGGSGPGGTAHMYQQVERRNGRILWIDTRTLR